jgi:hypothetical protein
MPTEQPKATLLANIAADLADNNAGNISAEDVRSNLEDTAESINSIVAKGDTDVSYAFEKNVRATDSTSDGLTGVFVAEWGVEFPDGMQTVKYPGAAGVDHNALANLTTADPHTQYAPVDGSRQMEGNFGMDTYSINHLGAANTTGISFATGGDSKTEMTLDGRMVFDDSSTLETSAGVPKAWVTFDASSGNLTFTGYNVVAVSLTAQKFEITIKEGTLVNNDYIVTGYSNARETASNNTDFDRHTIGATVRTGAGTVGDKRKLSFAVLNEAGDYVDNAKQNHIMIFGQGPNDNADYITTGSIT